MAISKEIITANEALKDLSDDQITALETLSANDEKTVLEKAISKAKGEVFGAFDADIKEVAGLEKASATEPTHAYMKRAFAEYKTQLEGSKGLSEKLTALEAKVTDYETQIAAGNTDKVIKQKLKDAEDRLAAAQEELTTTKTALTDKETEFSGRLKKIEINKAYDSASANLKFKKEFAGIGAKLLKTANADVLEKFTPDFVEEGGKQVLVFRDADGTVQTNKANGLKPFTYQELLAKELGAEVLGETQKVEGVETKKPGGGPDTVELVDISGATTQVQADELIAKHLMQKGVLRGSADFIAQQGKIRAENNVDKLPTR